MCIDVLLLAQCVRCWHVLTILVFATFAHHLFTTKVSSLSAQCATRQTAKALLSRVLLLRFFHWLVFSHWADDLRGANRAWMTKRGRTCERYELPSSSLFNGAWFIRCGSAIDYRFLSWQYFTIQTLHSLVDKWEQHKKTSNECFLQTVRLRGGNRYGQGRIEIFNNGSWGLLCDDYFDNKDADVICRQLGFER